MVLLSVPDKLIVMTYLCQIDQGGKRGYGGVGRFQMLWELTGQNSARDGGVSVTHSTSQFVRGFAASTGLLSNRAGKATT